MEDKVKTKGTEGEDCYIKIKRKNIKNELKKIFNRLRQKIIRIKKNGSK